MSGQVEPKLWLEIGRELLDELSDAPGAELIVVAGHGVVVAPHHLRRLISGLRALAGLEETADRIDALQLGLGLAIEVLAEDHAELLAAGCGEDPATAELGTLVQALRELLADGEEG